MRELSGLKALVVEDEGAVALLIEEMLEDLGCEIAGSAASVADACDMARTGAFDFAVLDVNLDGESVFSVAEALRERRIPFLFSTGYGAGGLPSEFKMHPVLSKPFRIGELQRVIETALSQTTTKA